MPRPTDDELAERLRAACQQVPPGTAWLHHRGRAAKVLTVTLDEATLEPLVVYVEPGASVRWARTLADFLARFTRKV